MWFPVTILHELGFHSCSWLMWSLIVWKRLLSPIPPSSFFPFRIVAFTAILFFQKNEGIKKKLFKHLAHDHSNATKIHSFFKHCYFSFHLKNEWTLKPCFMKVHSNQTMGSFYMVFYVHSGDLVNENPFLPFSII